MIDFALSSRQQQLREMIHGFAASVIRPVSLQWDREHRIDDEFLSRFVAMASTMGGPAAAWGVQGLGAASAEGDKKEASGTKKPSSAMVTTVLAAEELAWGDPALLLNL